MEWRLLYMVVAGCNYLNVVHSSVLGSTIQQSAVCRSEVWDFGFLSGALIITSTYMEFLLYVCMCFISRGGSANIPVCFLSVQGFSSGTFCSCMMHVVPRNTLCCRPKYSRSKINSSFFRAAFDVCSLLHHLSNNQFYCVFYKLSQPLFRILAPRKGFFFFVPNFMDV